MAWKKGFLLAAVLWAVPFSAAADITVYDDNGQFLGVLIDDRSDTHNELLIYIPSMKLTTAIYVGYSGPLLTRGDIKAAKIYWTQDNCQGFPYMIEAYQPMHILVKSGGAYYAPAKEDVGAVSLESFRDELGACESSVSGPISTALTAQQVPPEYIPFSRPVAFPLEYRYVRGTAVVPLGP